MCVRTCELVLTEARGNSSLRTGVIGSWELNSGLPQAASVPNYGTISLALLAPLEVPLVPQCSYTQLL